MTARKSSKNVVIPLRIVAILPNISTVPSDDDEEEDKKIQNFALPQGQEMSSEMEASKINITFGNVKEDLTVKNCLEYLI